MPRSQLAVFLRRFLPVALITIAGAWYYDHRETERRLDTLKNREVLSVGLGSSSLLRHIHSVVGDIHFIAGHSALQKLVHDSASPEIERLEANFPSLLQAKQAYDQIRWISARGQEKVRVDRIDGQPRLVPPEELQNKADRYYFTEAMQQDPGSIYLSRFDLNIENGKVEVPYKPMLRLATPVADQNGVKKGVVIINHLGQAMIDRLIAVSRGSEGDVSLLDSSGYWLRSPNAADEWGFMFNDATRNLGSRFPASWARMKGQRGQFEDEHGLWTFESVYPLRTDVPGSQPSTADVEGEYRWLVVSHLEPKKIAALTDQGSLERWLIAGCILLFAGFGARALQNVAQREHESEERFRAIFDYAMVGMATLSPAREWLSVNPALCRILGYEAESLLQKTWPELTHPDDMAADSSKFDVILRGDSEIPPLEIRFIRKDGSIVHTAISACAIRKANREVDFLVAVIEDISNRVLAESERRSSVQTLQRFIDHLPGTASVKDADSRILVASKGFQEKFGINPKEMIGHLPTEVFPAELSKKLVADDARVLATGVTEIVEYQWDGRIFESTKFIIPRDDGNADLGGITIDVTERRLTELKLFQQASRSAVLLDLPKKAEELTEKAFMQYALERSEELTHSAIGFMHFVNVDGETIELVTWSASTLARYCTAAFDTHYPISEAGIWANAAREKRPIVVNDYASAKNKHGLPSGHSALTRLLSIPVMEAGTVRMMTGVGNKADDYSDFDVETVQLIGSATWRIVRRQRSENALRLATQVVNASHVVCFRWAASDDWPVLFVSENVAQWGYRADQLAAGKPPFSELLHPDDRPRIFSEIMSHTASGASGYEQEYRLLTATNQVIWVNARTTIVRDANGIPEYHDGVLTNITERKNQQLMLSDALAQQKKLNKRLEEANNQLMQSEKMASIGQLAAGVAHELNNPIGFVHSNLGTLDGYVHDLMAIITAFEKMIGKSADASSLEEEAERVLEQHDFDFLRNDIYNLLAESKDGLGRVRKIVQDLKNFSRVGEQEWQEADLHQGIDSTLNIVWNELKYKVRVVKEYGEIPLVFCLISQLNQVFMNLLVNAGHAIEAQGTITIRTGRHGDDKVFIEISDTGKGIAPEHLNRIFEPFFTTKPVGQGTGLGLSLSYGIVKRHAGQIEVESVEGQGTTFRLLLPINPGQTTETKDSETA